MSRTPAQIEAFLDEAAHKLDLPVQYLGDEPNAHRKPWDEATVRWLMVASWPYEQAAGNSSIPAVYKAVNIGRDDFLCDRFYLPATPRDLRILDKAGVGVFGIESKHPLADFDVVGTSISYPVLSMSYLKMLAMSGIPLRWRDREAQGLGRFPMVIVGGQGYGAPETLAPVVDCWWLGEVEDEPGNPGITAVNTRIAGFKADGRWASARLSCYQDLAREFDFLYFPRFVDVHYHDEDRSHVGVGPHPSKQVVAYTSNLDGMRLPLRRRIVKDLDTVAPLDDPPLLYADPAMGSGDLEVGRGCPAWCSFCALCLSGDSRVLTSAGVRRLDSLVGEVVEVWTSGGWQKAEVDQYGTSPLNRVTFVPADFGGFGGADTCAYGHPRTGEIETGGHQTGRAAKLTQEKAEEIRARFMAGDVTQRQLAQEYGVARPQISLLVRGLAWRPNKLKRAVTADSSCRTCRRIKAKNAYYRTTGRPELVQELVRVEGWRRERGWRQLPRPSLSVTHEATALHRWPLVDGTETHHIKVGDFVRADFVREVQDPEAVERGFIHGFVFGDGTESRPTRKGRVYSVGLWGAKDTAHAPRFARFLREDLKHRQDPVAGIAVLRLSEPVPTGANGVPRSEIRLVTDVPMKDFPVEGMSPDYVRGFLEGWLAADGTASDGPQSVELATQHPGARAWLEHYAAYAGWVLIGDVIDSVVETNLMKRKAPLHRLTLTRASAWKVVAIEEGTEPKPVYCATVPGEGFFTLASGVYTGNTFRQKPYRQRSVEYVTRYAKRFAGNMGSTRMAPFSPDFPMYTQRKQLIAALLENVSDEVDAPAMRVDDFIADSDFILLQVHGGMDAVTLGVEGNSQRMRDLVGKGTSDADIREAVTRGIRAGIRKFKLFMISNLPGEDEGDVFRILKLAKDLADIRESMNQPVRIQFSWTPLMIEANTPMQWFAPSPATRILGDVWEEFRDFKIDFKLGAKAEPNKAAFFQLCQRASRDVGEALVDAMEAAGQACWGGVPRTFKDLIEGKLHAHGFRNGYGDCFDERLKHDMFGWEFIDQGISTELLWVTYLQMREFIEQTDSHTYDLNFDADYHGAEWIQRCDEKCQGKTCGACDHADLKIRQRYITSADKDIDLAGVKLLDQRTQAFRVRARLHKPARYRFVGNDHWRFNLRRAAFRAQAALGCDAGIAKRSIRFASDEIKHRDWTCGVDYVEFGMTRPMTVPAFEEFIAAMNTELGDWMHLQAWHPHPAAAATMRADTGVSLFELEVDDQPAAVLAKLGAWRAAGEVPMQLKVDGGYFAPASETVNAKQFTDDLWLVRDGHRLLLRMLIRGRPSPYNIYAALMGRASWLDAARTPAVRLDAFAGTDRRQQDFLRPNCADCGLQIPVNILDEPWDPDRCPRCRDEHADIVVSAATYA